MAAQGLHASTVYGGSVISVDHLVIRFGRQTILEDISFTVRRGETLAILGRSGSGKSVTLKTIVGLIEPSNGTVTVLGERVHDLRERERLAFRRNIGYVFQDAALFDSLTVLENVGFPLYQQGLPPDQIKERVTERLAMVGLGHALHRMPAELSGGMRKRVGLARAIIELPPIVLYDEPTSGLDPLTTDVINQIILRLRSRLSVTSVVVTHDIGSAFTIADRIIMIDHGRVVIDGTPDAIQQSDNPWVQHFISGQALEHEGIDSGRFNLPSGFTTRFAAPRPDAVASGQLTIPPTIRRRRRPSGRGATSLSGRRLIPAQDDADAGVEEHLPYDHETVEGGALSGARPISEGMVIDLDEDGPAASEDDS